MCSCTDLLSVSVNDLFALMTSSTAWGPGGHRDTLRTISFLSRSGVFAMGKLRIHPGASTTVMCLPAVSPSLFTHSAVSPEVSNSSLPRMVFPDELFPSLLLPSSTILMSKICGASPGNRHHDTAKDTELHATSYSCTLSRF